MSQDIGKAPSMFGKHIPCDKVILRHNLSTSDQSILGDFGNSIHLTRLLRQIHFRIMELLSPRLRAISKQSKTIAMQPTRRSHLIRRLAAVRVAAEPNQRTKNQRRHHLSRRIRLIRSVNLSGVRVSSRGVRRDVSDSTAACRPFSYTTKGASPTYSARPID